MCGSICAVENGNSHCTQRFGQLPPCGAICMEATDLFCAVLSQGVQALGKEVETANTNDYEDIDEPSEKGNPTSAQRA